MAKRKKYKINKTLVLLLNVKGAQGSWQVQAHLKHVSDGLKKVLPVEELILMPVVDQPTALYWLEGKLDPEYQKTFDAIQDKIKPVLHTVLEECLEIKPTK